jgi:hypothetical protein
MQLGEGSWDLAVLASTNGSKNVKFYAYTDPQLEALVEAVVQQYQKAAPAAAEAGGFAVGCASSSSSPTKHRVWSIPPPLQAALTGLATAIHWPYGANSVGDFKYTPGEQYKKWCAEGPISLPSALNNCLFPDVGQWLRSEVVHGLCCVLFFLRATGRCQAADASARGPWKNMYGVHAFMTMTAPLAVLARAICALYTDAMAAFITVYGYCPMAWDPIAIMAWGFSFRSVYRMPDMIIYG